MSKSHILILILLKCSLSNLFAVDSVPFVEAKPEEGHTTVSLRINAGECLYIKLEKGFLGISPQDIGFKTSKKKKTITESCALQLTHIKHDRVSTEFLDSVIVYSYQMKDGGNRSLNVLEGTQAFHKAGLKFGWSYKSAKTIFIYVPINTKYAIIPNRKERDVNEPENKIELELEKAVNEALEKAKAEKKKKRVMETQKKLKKFRESEKLKNGNGVSVLNTDSRKRFVALSGC